MNANQYGHQNSPETFFFSLQKQSVIIFERVFRHQRLAKAPNRLRSLIWRQAQSDLGLHCPFTESFDAVEHNKE